MRPVGSSSDNVRGSALWGKGSKGELRSSALWGKPSRVEQRFLGGRFLERGQLGRRGLGELSFRKRRSRRTNPSKE